MILNEKYLNIFNKETKQQYADEVYALLQKSYQPLGGLKGNGFSSPDDMIDSIPLWKLYFNQGTLECVIMYKDKGGRKLVALGVSGSPKSKQELRKIIAKEFDRSYFEVSGALLKFMVKNFGEDFLLTYGIQYRIDSTHQPATGGEICTAYPKLCHLAFKTTIGDGVPVEKVKLGTHSKIITFKDFVNRK